MPHSIDKFGRSSSRRYAVRGPTGVGFKRTLSGNFDLEHRMLRNVNSQPIQSNDVSTKKYVDESIQDINVKFIEYNRKLEKAVETNNKTSDNLLNAVKTIEINKTEIEDLKKRFETTSFANTIVKPEKPFVQKSKSQLEVSTIDTFAKLAEERSRQFKKSHNHNIKQLDK